MSGWMTKYVLCTYKQTMHIPEFIVICFPQKLMLEYLRVVQLAAEKAIVLITNT